MSATPRVVVVGASAAGLATVEALRRKGHDGPVTVVGAEPYPPYDRPPLSKQVLAGSWPPERTRLRTAEVLEGLGAEWVLGDPATGLDPLSRTVATASGRAVGGDAVVVATGARPRTLPGQEPLTGVHVLRTLDEAAALRADLLDRGGNGRGRLVVVGEGVLGAEAAATACGLGVDTALVGPQRVPMEAQLGPLVGGLLAELHRGEGVRLRLGAAVSGLADDGGGRVRGVLLDTGEELPADTVLVAVGARPETDWLEGSGLEVSDGLVCDAHCRAAEGVYAVGDVSRWYHEGLGRSVRLENRTNAVEQAGAVAAAVLGDERPYVPVPYLWTDQFGAKIQIHGLPSASAEAEVVEGSPEDGRFVVRFRRGSRTEGVLGWNMPKQARQWRREVAEAFAAPSPVGGSPVAG
ncbi:NAD(P)/FAD-dependent oxidoreductase [Nocardiopsis suaedae]|uniref:FAD-dependent oxidoreductase n=1 Tax=Nocardiopsis suaedae TaxID=3018444 RepID=A0ABT4TQ27_9ACTN|nr:FAD-dependent oxidoreductase [Nocardiopsis suaedae]MDA2806782.1 FAD-dependent oxidoreductase [Nocardiopsis suaedae]